MRKHAIAPICIAVVLTLGIGSATAEEPPRVADERPASEPQQPQRDPQWQPRWCEQVGSGLWDCEDEVCSDWNDFQSSCEIRTYHRDGVSY